MEAEKENNVGQSLSHRTSINFEDANNPYLKRVIDAFPNDKIEFKVIYEPESMIIKKQVFCNNIPVREAWYNPEKVQDTMFLDQLGNPTHLMLEENFSEMITQQLIDAITKWKAEHGNINN